MCPGEVDDGWLQKNTLRVWHHRQRCFSFSSRHFVSVERRKENGNKFEISEIGVLSHILTAEYLHIWSDVSRTACFKRVHLPNIQPKVWHKASGKLWLEIPLQFVVCRSAEGVRVLQTCWKPHKSKDHNFLHRNYTQIFFLTPIFFSSKKIKKSKNPKP